MNPAMRARASGPICILRAPAPIPKTEEENISLRIAVFALAVFVMAAVGYCLFKKTKRWMKSPAQELPMYRTLTYTNGKKY